MGSGGLSDDEGRAEQDLRVCGRAVAVQHVGEQIHAAGGGFRQRLADAGQADGLATAVSSKPTTAQSRPSSRAARMAPSASESMAQTSAVTSGNNSRAASAPESMPSRVAAAGPRLAEGLGPAGPPGVAHPGALRPAQEADPPMPGAEQVPGGLGGAGGVVDVDPGVGVRRAPRPAEGHERDLAAGQPGGAHVTVVGAGQDKGIEVVRGRAGRRTWRSHRRHRRRCRASRDNRPVRRPR